MLILSFIFIKGIAVIVLCQISLNYEVMYEQNLSYTVTTSSMKRLK